MYQLQPIKFNTTVRHVSDNIYIPFDPANIDYANFKREINAGEAELQDSDGNVMTAEEVKSYVKTLP